MKVSTDLMNVIVNQEQVSNDRLIDIILDIAKMNNISKDELLSNVSEFMRKVIVSMKNTTIEIIDKAKSDVLIKKATV